MLHFLTRPVVNRFILAALFLCTGSLHFIRPKGFMHIIPAFIPYHLEMVYISGAAEILGAAGILLSKTQSWAGWGLIILLIVVFPANIQMAIDAIRQQGWGSLYTLGTLLRLPLQFLLIYWVYWANIK